MPEEIHASTTPGGNGLNLKVGGKQLGITGPVVIPVLCLALVAGIGWIRSNDLKESMREVNTHLQALYVRQEEIRRDLQDQTKEMLNVLRDNREGTGEKMQALATQTTELRHAIGAQTTELVHRFETQTTELTKRLSTLAYNIDKPPELRLPLNLSPEALPQPEKGR